eukprot:6201558-Pleurochrysis_carterae.AAC.1
MTSMHNRFRVHAKQPIRSFSADVVTKAERTLRGEVGRQNAGNSRNAPHQVSQRAMCKLNKKAKYHHQGSKPYAAAPVLYCDLVLGYAGNKTRNAHQLSTSSAFWRRPRTQ